MGFNSSRFCVLFLDLIASLGLSISFPYFFMLGGLLGVFLLFRFPYVYGIFFFICFLLGVLFSLFFSLFLSRSIENFILFFASLVPVGAPLYICPLVCLAEGVSYVVRPFVLIFRPFINISLGCVGSATLAGFVFTNSAWLGVVVFVLFYELFVALVHWFIVGNILSFSVDH